MFGCEPAAVSGAAKAAADWVAAGAVVVKDWEVAAVAAAASGTIRERFQ